MSNIARDLEVCIMHCNETIVDLCRASLKHQTLQPARIYEVVNIEPLNQAYNKYYAGMKLDYCVKLDADILLYPTALERLYDEFKKADKKYYCMIGFVKDTVAGRSSGVRITKNIPEIKNMHLPNIVACDRKERWIMREIHDKHCFSIEDEVALHVSNWNGIDSLASTFFNTGEKVATLGDPKLKLLKQICEKWIATGDIEPLIAMICFCHGLFHTRHKEKRKGHGKKVAQRIKYLLYKQKVLYNHKEQRKRMKL